MALSRVFRRGSKKVTKKIEERIKKEHPAIEIIKERIAERLDTLNLSMNLASQRGGLGLSYVFDVMNDKNRNPQKAGLMKLAQALDCDVEYLTGEQAAPRAHEIQVTPHVAASTAAPIKLYNIGLTDPEGFFKADESNKSNFVSPVQPSGAGIYCLTVPDDTMAPRYGFGEVVIVNPRKSASKGGFAVVRMTDDRLIIREVVNIGLDKIAVKCLATNEVTELPRQDVKSLERIVASCELV
jgi:SOS-response transcriptional repressor LexA